jgi:hypothetical protein
MVEDPDVLSTPNTRVEKTRTMVDVFEKTVMDGGITWRELWNINADRKIEQGYRYPAAGVQVSLNAPL